MDILASFFSFAGIFLNAKKKILCWPVWNMASLLWVIHFIPRGEYFAAGMMSLYLITNTYGWWCWVQERNLCKPQHQKTSSTSGA